MDEDITSESEVGSDGEEEAFSTLLRDHDMEETAAEKKLRLAKMFPAERAKLTTDLEGDLETEVLEKSGRLQIPIADKIRDEVKSHYEVRNAHKSSITCSCYFSDGKEDSMLLYTACKKSVV